MGYSLSTEKFFSLSLLTALTEGIGQTKPLIGFCMLVFTQILLHYLCYVPNQVIVPVSIEWVALNMEINAAK